MTLKLDFAQVESVIDTIIDEARTGEIGDGKIFGNVNYFSHLVFMHSFSHLSLMSHLLLRLNHLQVMV
jgi:hypothetical protein